MGNYMRFEDLEIWKESMRVCEEIYKLLKDCRDFGLRDQMQRAAVSVVSNIAEGYERKGTKETVHFLYISKASCGELRTQLYLAIHLKYIDEETGNKLLNDLVTLNIKIYRYIKAINKTT